MKTRNGGKWTEARFRTFVTSGLRATSRKWPPIHAARKKAWVRRGVYKCNGCKKNVRATKDGKNNIFVDHIEPVVPKEGWSDWDSYIERLFCEEDNLQVLCKTCHDRKSKKERKKT